MGAEDPADSDGDCPIETVGASVCKSPMSRNGVTEKTRGLKTCVTNDGISSKKRNFNSKGSNRNRLSLLNR